MKELCKALGALVLAVGFSHASLAQEPPAATQAPPQQAAPAVSEADLDTFATIYVDLKTLNTEFEGEMAAVESEAEAQELQEQMQQQSVETIEEHGWSLERYNLVAQAINSDSDLLTRALELIAEKS